MLISVLATYWSYLKFTFEIHTLNYTMMQCYVKSTSLKILPSPAVWSNCHLLSSILLIDALLCFALSFMLPVLEFVFHFQSLGWNYIRHLRNKLWYLNKNLFFSLLKVLRNKNTYHLKLIWRYLCRIYVCKVPALVI